MLKRQKSSLSSSRRHAVAVAATSTTPPPSETHHAKAICCMSGIFRLFSKYQNPNKRLTLGGKREKLKPPSPTKAKKSGKEDKIGKDDTERLIFSIKLDRSPTLSQEFRRSSASAAVAKENPRTPPSSSLVARLMGLDLEDLAAAAAERKTLALVEDRVTEKRRRLLRALEKCDEDLETLKRIIEAVQTTDVRVRTPIPVSAAGKIGAIGGDPVPEETNFPAGVAEELSRSSLSRTSVVQVSTTGVISVPQQRKFIATKKPGENDEPIIKPLNNLTSNIESTLHMRWQAATTVKPPRCSQALIDSLEEVCRDIAWGEKREIERIGLVLQEQLCKQLIEEFVRELVKSCPIDHSLPFEACKRKLCF